MATHSLHFEDDEGNLTDIEYFDSAICLKDRLMTIDGTLGYLRLMDHGNTLSGGESQAYGGMSWGIWPGGAETDYDVYCSFCGELLWYGLDSDV